MNWFKWKQWLLALCAVATVNVQGATLDEWRESTPPISYRIAEDENVGYSFIERLCTHSDYSRLLHAQGGINKKLWIELPSNDTPMLYLQVCLQDPSQASQIAFSAGGNNLSYTDGSVWISPDVCSKQSTVQYLNFTATVSTSGTFPYTIKAFTSREAEEPVAVWDGTFYYSRNYPTISIP